MDNLLRVAVDKVDDLFFVFSPEGTYLEWNAAVPAVTGYDDEELSELHPTDLVTEGYRTQIADAMGQVMRERVSITVEADLLTKNGEHLPYEYSGSPIEDGGELVAIAGIGRDITERREHVEELNAMAEELRELSMPIVEVWDGIVLSTIIGRLDSDRAERFTEDLLEKIVEKQSEVAIIDITEVSVLDTNTAQHLIDTIQAVQLLGSEIIITGIKPEISQTLVRLGIGFDVETQSTLTDGLETALQWKEATIA